MKPLGILLAVLGAAMMIAAFGVDGTVESSGASRVYNTGLLNEKLMLAIAGGASFVGGVVIAAVAEMIEALSRKLAEREAAPPTALN